MNIITKESGLFPEKDLMQYGATTILKTVYEGMMNAERKIFLEECDECKNKANGYYKRIAKGLHEAFEIDVPRDRAGLFRSEILDIIDSQENKNKELAYKLYTRGLTTREIEDIFKDIFGQKMSSTSVSNVVKLFSEERNTWLNKPLQEEYTFIYLDALFVPVRRDYVEKEAFYIFIGLRKDGRREILGLYNIPSESAEGWSVAIKDLKSRGLKRTNLIIADGLSGLSNVVEQEFRQGCFQRCVTHIKRGILLKVRSINKKEIAYDLRQIFTVGDASYTLDKAKLLIDVFLKKWASLYPSIRKVFAEENLESYFAYLKFPYQIQSMIYTTNWIERLNRTIRRTQKIRASFPSPQSAMDLISACLIDEEEKFYMRYRLTKFIEVTDFLEEALHKLN